MTKPVTITVAPIFAALRNEPASAGDEKVGADVSSAVATARLRSDVFNM
jgi:hypothetical protein